MSSYSCLLKQALSVGIASIWLPRLERKFRVPKTLARVSLQLTKSFITASVSLVTVTDGNAIESILSLCWPQPRFEASQRAEAFFLHLLINKELPTVGGRVSQLQKHVSRVCWHCTQNVYRIVVCWQRIFDRTVPTALQDRNCWIPGNSWWLLFLRHHSITRLPVCLMSASQRCWWNMASVERQPIMWVSLAGSRADPWSGGQGVQPLKQNVFFYFWTSKGSGNFCVLHYILETQYTRVSASMCWKLGDKHIVFIFIHHSTEQKIEERNLTT